MPGGHSPKGTARGLGAKPKYLTKTNSFKRASDLSVAEPANQTLSRLDADERQHRGGKLMSPKKQSDRRMSVNRASMIRTEVLDQFKIDKLYESKKSNTPLGKGSYGAVTLVKEIFSGQELALKTVHKPSIENIVRLQREILIMKRLDHPSIVKLFAVYEDATNLYFLLELCSGGELFDRIVKASRFDEPTAASVIRQVLSALAYTHANNIMHRDIKPENILYSEDGPDTGHVKLIDWGFSAKFGADQKFSSVVGTPFYVAPEVLASFYDYRCDMWSLGVLLYILLSGAPPFYGEDNKAILKAIRRGKYDLEKKRWQNVSESAKDLIRHLLVADPDQRYSAQKAMKHPWIMRHAASPVPIDKTMSRFVVDKLKTFHSFSVLERLSFTCMAHVMSPKDSTYARNIFHAFDEDNDGVLTITEVIKKLHNAGVTISDKIHEYLDAMDTDGNGTIDYTEFLAAIMDHEAMAKDERNVLAAFRVLDHDAKRYISSDDIVHVVHQTTLNHHKRVPVDRPNVAPIELAERMIKECKDGRTGYLLYPEFLMMLRGASTSSSSSQSNGRSSIRRTDQSGPPLPVELQPQIHVTPLANAR